MRMPSQSTGLRRTVSATFVIDGVFPAARVAPGRPGFSLFRSPGLGRLDYTCTNDTCDCDGVSDCVDLAETGPCKGKLVCGRTKCTCKY
jgi:hypothetical protein